MLFDSKRFDDGFHGAAAPAWLTIGQSAFGRYWQLIFACPTGAGLSWPTHHTEQNAFGRPALMGRNDMPVGAPSAALAQLEGVVQVMPSEAFHVDRRSCRPSGFPLLR
jgi:hypothetical protein